MQKQNLKRNSHDSPLNRTPLADFPFPFYESGTEPRMTEPRKTEPRKTERRTTEPRMTRAPFIRNKLFTN